jgi:hypothetical protein
MRRHRLALALLLAFSVPPIGAQPAHGRSYELRGGWWFTGTAFERRHVYVADSSFAARRPVVIDSVIDLRDQYLVPPFRRSHAPAHLSGVGRQRSCTPPARRRLLRALAHGLGVGSTSGSVPRE